MSKIIFDMPNSAFKKAFEKKIAKELSDNNFLNSTLKISSRSVNRFQK